MDGKINLDNEIFGNFVEDLNQMLRNTVSTMEKRDVCAGEVGIKLTIVLDKILLAQSDSEIKTVTKPRVIHKIETKFVLKDSKNGSASGEYELIYDEETGEYKVRPVYEQGSFFDDDTIFGTATDNPEREWDLQNEQCLLEENNEVVLSDEEYADLDLNDEERDEDEDD